jgi:hypothetical protein
MAGQYNIVTKLGDNNEFPAEPMKNHKNGKII